MTAAKLPTIMESSASHQIRSCRIRDGDASIGPKIFLTLPIFDQNQAGIASAQYAYDQATKVVEALKDANPKLCIGIMNL